MAGSYINRTYFADVHPPLGKLIITLFGCASGYDGSFPFQNPGDSYIDESGEHLAPYIPIRISCAIFGCFVVFSCCVLVHTVTQSLTAGIFTSVLMIFDIGLITLSRFILLDPIMLFFMFMSVLCFGKMSSYQRWSFIGFQKQDNSFSFCWWIYLLLCGFSLGCALSVKFVGIFTVLFVGALTISDLWTLLAFVPKHGAKQFWKHLYARIFGLIFVPLLTYIVVFYIHFTILSHSGDGAIFHSSKFQAGLKGNPLYNQSIPVHVECNTSVTLRNQNVERMYLHSHNLIYPVKDNNELQQVTGYAVRDGNNLWKVLCVSKATGDGILQNGSLVKLTHLLTNKFLGIPVDANHHWKHAPLTPWLLMAAAHDREDNFSDLWKIVLITSSEDMCTMDCLFMLHNVASACYLCSTNKALPDWGKKQHEVVCSSRKRDLKNCVWTAQSMSRTRNDVPMKSVPTLSYFSKFVEAHQVMFNLNSKLVKTPGELVSKPWQWPLNYKPKLFSKQEDHIYLIGTPVVWWVNIISITTFLLISLCTSIIDARKEAFITLHPEQSRENTLQDRSFVYRNKIDFEKFYRTRRICTWFFVGWILHYVPFFAMSRVLFLHHYFPAHLFACMISGTLLDLLLTSFSDAIAPISNILGNTVYHSTFTIIVSVVAHNFYISSSLCFGPQQNAGDWTSFFSL